MSVGQVVRDYVAISKLRISLLLVIVAWGTMFLAARGPPAASTFWAVTIAGVTSTAAAGAFNHIVEREQDSRMARTANRPLVTGRIKVWQATTYAVAMTLASFAVLYLVDALLAAILTLGAIAYYVLVYTLLLKPNTAQSVVIGGIAGSFPAWIGAAAVLGTLDAGAWIVALVLFFWSPAHFWALALMLKDDYKAAEYPILPNTAGEANTRIQVVVYASLTAASSLLLLLVGVGYIYTVAAAVLGTLFVVRAIGMLRNPVRERYRGFFFFSLLYLALLMLALMADQAWLIALPF